MLKSLYAVALPWRPLFCFKHKLEKKEDQLTITEPRLN